jgi:hypothetical protein
VPRKDAPIQGPTEAPLLTKEAPIGWWSSHVATLFDAAAQISSLIAEMQAVNIVLMTPMVGYSAFSAVSMNIYAQSFPWVDKRRHVSEEPGDQGTEIFKHLERFAQEWPIGESWVGHSQLNYL